MKHKRYNTLVFCEDVFEITILGICFLWALSYFNSRLLIAYSLWALACGVAAAGLHHRKSWANKTAIFVSVISFVILSLLGIRNVFYRAVGEDIVVGCAFFVFAMFYIWVIILLRRPKHRELFK